MRCEDIFESKILILKEIAEAITSTDNIDSITSLILNLALNYTKAKSGSILLVNEDGELIVKAARGMSVALIAALKLRIGERICGRVALERRPLLVKDIETDKRVQRKGKKKYKTKSFICCPILMKDKVLGVINISDKADGTPFTEDELGLISILANQAAITLENARLMSELRSKALEFDEINRGLIEDDKIKTEFIARMSHELRTPLNSIKGAAYYLEKRVNLNAEQKEFLEIISKETNKLINILNGLMDFSRFNGEEFLLNKKNINLNEVLQEVIKSKTIKDLLKYKKLSILQMLSKKPVYIIADRTRIILMFINIIEGIIRYTSMGDVIEVKTLETEPAAEIELLLKGKMITDNGLSYIFESHTLGTLPETFWHNLKFYLAKKTVETHKGTILAQNTPQGFSIKLIIPKNLKERQDVQINELMKLFVSFIAESMDLNTCSLMLTDELTGDLTINAAYGLDKEIIKRTRLKIGDKIAGLVAAEKKPLLIRDVEKDPLVKKTNNPNYNTRSLLSVPIIFDTRVGVLNLNNKESGEVFDIKDLCLVTTIANHIASILKKMLRGDLTEKDFIAICKGLDRIINAEERYGKKNRRLLDLVFQIMRELGCSEKDIGLVLYASILYDIGLTQIDKNILEKQQELTPIERRIIDTHPVCGIGLIGDIGFTDTIEKIILYHHERFDGSGYPKELKGEDIPLGSRVLAVVDTYLAMTGDRPYRKASEEGTAKEHIMSSKGTKFDPKVVDAFLRTINKNLHFSNVLIKTS